MAPAECATTDIPDHLHDQDIVWFRLDPSLSVGLGRGWVASVGVPVDVRDVTVAYTTPDGAAYDPPYADIHHRTETLFGPADGTATIKFYGAVGKVVLGGGVGTSLPIGRIESDPYAAGLAGEQHQHLQLGSGTFNPLVSVDAMYAQGRWGAFTFASGRFPLYANEKGYQAPVAVSGGVGPTFKVLPTFIVMASVEANWESEEHWGGTAYAGKTAIGVGAGVVWSVSPAVALQLQGRGNVWEAVQHQDEEGTFSQPLTATAGVSWTFGKHSAE